MAVAKQTSHTKSPRGVLTGRMVLPAGVTTTVSEQDRRCTRLSSCPMPKASLSVRRAAERAGVIRKGDDLPASFTDDQVRRMMSIAPGRRGIAVAAAKLPAQEVVSRLLGVSGHTVKKHHDRALASLRKDPEIAALLADGVFEDLV